MENIILNQLFSKILRRGSTLNLEMDIEIGATGLTRLDENRNTDGLQYSHNDKSYTESSPYRYEENYNVDDIRFRHIETPNDSTDCVRRPGQTKR